MKDQPFHWEIDDILTQFVAALDGAIVKRYNESDRKAREVIGVRYIFGPKERVMADIVNGSQNITVPAVAIDVSSIARDQGRVHNKNSSVFINNAKTVGTAGSITPVRTPQPIKITVNVSIMTRYQLDMDQIISNFLPYFRPYIYLATQVPTTVTPDNNFEVRTKVTWNEVVSISTPTNLNYADKFARVGDTSFEINSWLYTESQDPEKLIYFPQATLYSIRNSITNFEYPSLSSQSTTLSGEADFIGLSAYPQFTNLYYSTSGQLIPVDNTFYLQQSAIRTFLIYGKNLNYVSSVLLSSNNTSLYTNLTTLSTEYYGNPSGFALELTDYNKLNANMMTVTIPQLSGGGSIDIIASNNVGWSTTYNISQAHIEIL